MIILIDNKNYMIRYCEDSPEIHGFDVSFPHWEICARFLSDIGYTVVLSGKEAEDYLDEHDIYYIHVENKAKENFVNFTKRLARIVKENKEFLDRNSSWGVLVTGLTRDFSKDITVDTINCVEIWKMHEDGRYYIGLDLDDVTAMTRSDAIAYLDKVEALAIDELKAHSLDEIISDARDVFETYEDEDELYSADNLHDILINLIVLVNLIATKNL